jgi:hypothetical protein
MSTTKEEVADAVRVWCHAWHTRDIETLLAMGLWRSDLASDRAPHVTMS